MNFGIAEVYYGASGKVGFYNNQQIGLSRAMKKLGYKCFVFMPDINLDQPTEEHIEDDITVVRCPAKMLGVHARYDWSILTRYNIDVVQVGSDNHLFAGDLIRYCDKYDIKAYSYFGTVESDNNNRLKRTLMNLLFRRNVSVFRNHANFAKTEKVKSNLESFGIPCTKVVPVGLDTSVIPQIDIDRNTLRQELDLPGDKKVLLYVGRIDSYKRPELMLSLVKDLDYSYGVIIGDGSLSQDLDNEIKRLNLQNRIKWIKKLPNDQVQSYYAAADYFVNFNDHEIFGMSILEAMYQGCTVAAFHAPGPDTIIEDGISGYLVSDMASMKHIIEEDKKLPFQAVTDRIIASFTWDCTARSFNEWILAE